MFTKTLGLVLRGKDKQILILCRMNTDFTFNIFDEVGISYVFV